jgi:four helix bundle protein
MSDYRDLVVWQVAHDATLLAYRCTKHFPKDEIFGLTSQLRRSISSVPANIAEGNGRGSRKDYVKHLIIARGSLNEARYFIQLSFDLQYLASADHEALSERMERASRLLAGLIRSLRRKGNEP